MTLTDDYLCRCELDSDIRDHLPFLYEQARGRRVIELGVRGGNSTAAFLAAVEDGGHLWSVDILDPQVPAEWYDSDRWTFILGDDLDVADRIPGDADVVFIDTSHGYFATMFELDVYSRKLMPGGVLLLHDTELEHPYAQPNHPPYPVRKAIDDWAAQVGWPVEYRDGCFGLGVIHKPEGR